MSYYDYDYEAEPNYPEVEEIIDEASGKFDEFLRSTFVAEYKNIQVAKENNAIKENRLNERSRSIDERERDLQEREAELAKSEKEQYEKLKSKWFIELGLDFDIGSTVYYLKDITKRVTCPTCDGNKKVKAKIESADNTVQELEINCPTCHPYGTITGKKEFEIVEAKVSQIDAHISKRESGNIHIEYWDGGFDLVTCVWVNNRKDNDLKHIKGSDLFKTKEEAQRHIEELLAKESK